MVETYELDSKTLEFLKNNTHLDLAKDILEAIDEDGEPIIYWGDYTTGDEAYLIIKSALNNESPLKSYVISISDDMKYRIEDARPILDHLEQFDYSEKVLTLVLEQIKEHNCKPQEIMINYSGADDSHMDLESCVEYVNAILEILALIDTDSAREYVKLIEQDKILHKAKEMKVFHW